MVRYFLSRFSSKQRTWLGGTATSWVQDSAVFNVWMVILGAVNYNFWIAALASTTLIFGAAYTLWMVKRVYFGDVANDFKSLRKISTLKADSYKHLTLEKISLFVERKRSIGAVTRESDFKKTSCAPKEKLKPNEKSLENFLATSFGEQRPLPVFGRCCNYQ